MNNWTPEERAYAEKCFHRQSLTKTLKPCPFCGGPAELRSSKDEAFHIAGCADWDCLARGHGMKPESLEDAAARWNKRAKE